MLEEAKNLLKIKSLVTLLLTLLYCFMCIRNYISAEFMQNVYLMVIAFYFGTQYSKNKTGV